MGDLSQIRLYRMTRIENIPHILQHGITHIHSPNANPDYVPIGDRSLISTRNDLVLPNARRLGEYIPFYFGARMPMLYVIQSGKYYQQTPPQDIVYCLTTVEQVVQHSLDFLFTNGHAIVTALTTVFPPDQIQNIRELVDFEAVNTREWGNAENLDLKRRKEAEFLLGDDLPLAAIRGFVVYNEEALDQVLSFGIPNNQVVIRNNFYF